MNLAWPAACTLLQGAAAFAGSVMPRGCHTAGSGGAAGDAYGFDIGREEACRTVLQEGPRP